MNNLLNLILNSPRSYKRMVMMLTDLFWISLAFFGAYLARLSYIPLLSSHNIILFISVLSLTLFAFIFLGLYRVVLRYLSFHFLISLLGGVCISAISIVIFGFFLKTFTPRSIPFIYAAFLLVLCGGSRLLLRSFILQYNLKSNKRVLIYGAGSSGRQLELVLKQSIEYHSIAFIDDNQKLWGAVIQGLRVYDPNNIEKLVRDRKISHILLAFPSATREQRKKIIQRLAFLKVDVLSIPSLADIISGKAKIDQLRNVPIEELLGRDQVDPAYQLMQKHIKDKVVMVTGAGGSIGSELCRQILLYQPQKLILFDNSEYNLYKIYSELEALDVVKSMQTLLLPLLGSTLQLSRLEQVMGQLEVETVYHAAAYKHVPLVEYNIIEGIRNNIWGTLFSAQAAIKANVKTFVLISTDKAVRPTNIMGASKRFSELILQALSMTQMSTCFCMVRFGNVLGSSGSVVPLFKKQIAQGGPITITHAEITRYFMTIPEASQLVIQAGAMGKGGDVFVLDMGSPVKIIDLAYSLITLSGLTVKNESNPNGDIAIEYLGLRPGEKLYEELLIGDNVSTTLHPRIMVAHEQKLLWSEVEVLLDQLNDACNTFSYQKIRTILLTAPLEYHPNDDICDPLATILK